MVPPLMGLSLQTQCGKNNSLRLQHSVKLEVGVQLLYPFPSSAFGLSIKGRDGQFPNLLREIKIFLAPIKIPWHVPIFDGEKVL